MLMEKNMLFLEAWQAFHHATTISPICDELVNPCRNLGLSFTRFLKLFAFSEISCIRRHLPPIQFVDEVRTILYNRVLAVMIRSSRPHCRQKKRLILESDDCGSKLARDGEHCTEQERNVNGIGHWYRVSVLDFRSGCPP
ncbi:hypothetical protein ACQJBY_068529 [Aegilops geniculata]